MTVGIAAIADRNGAKSIVLACDARLSYNEAIPASDDGTLKVRLLGASNWGLMFAALDATAFEPVVNETHAIISGATLQEYSYSDIKNAAQKAYENEHADRFVREHLTPFGFHTIADWRKVAYQEMGAALYNDYAMKLARFDLGLELLGYGFDKDGRAHIFEVENPGKTKSHNLRGYAAIGSGTMMALAALNRRPLAGDLNSTIYRLLDAKFSSETAPSVGVKTYVVTLHQDGSFDILKSSAIDKVRKIWLEIQRQKEPDEAIDIIGKSLFRPSASA